MKDLQKIINQRAKNRAVAEVKKLCEDIKSNPNILDILHLKLSINKFKN